MKLSRIEPMQTHEPDDGKEEDIAIADIQQKRQSVSAIQQQQAETESGDVLSEETKGGLKRLADFLGAKKKQTPKKPPSLNLKAIKAYKALDKFELDEAQKATKIQKSA